MPEAGPSQMGTLETAAAHAADLATKAGIEVGYSQRRSYVDYPDLHTGAAWSVVTTVTNGIVRVAAVPALNAEVGYDFWLPSGIYRLDLAFWASNNSGIATPNLDGTDLAVVDAYNGATTFTAVSRTAISVATAGVKRLKFKMLSKNASSSDYQFLFNSLSLTRTAPF